MSIITTKHTAKQSVTAIKKRKNHQKISMVTAYDALFAKIFDKNVDMILVGDSLNMSFAGHKDTLSATLDQMIYHTQAVCNGAKETFIICDMPFGSYSTKEQALQNCIQVYQQTDADAVKIEGGKQKASMIQYLTQNSIAVMGHIGLMPQFVRSEGGYKVRGKTQDDIDALVEDAKALEDAGVFCIVIEGVKQEAAKAITQSVSVPTIGIGAGIQCDGQVLVWSDMFGFFEEFSPKFVRKYLDGASLIRKGLSNFTQDVESESFPSSDEVY